ncbi:MAG: hypothetical protein J7M25_03360 [Deltaproteobacteria bacterium]|nr:hypothetical protein [Deltaproteobacteria bacterium]
MGQQDRLKRIIRRTAFRLKLQRVAERTATTGLLAVVTLMLGLYYLKTGVLGWSDMWVFGLIASSWIATGVVWGLTIHDAADALAARVDAACGLHNALSSALLFSAELPHAPDDQKPFMEAEIRRAANIMDQASARKAVPFQWPRDTVPLTVLLAVLVGFAAMRIPQSQARAVQPRIKRIVQPRIHIDEALIREYQEELQDLKEQAHKLKDEQLEKFLRKQQKLLDDLRRGKLSKRDFLKRYNQLMKQFGKRQEQLGRNIEKMNELLSKAGKSFEKTKLTRKLAQALEEKNMEQAAKEMQKLLHKLQTGKMTNAQKRQLRKALRKAAEVLQKHKLARQLDQALRRQEQRIKEQMQRMDKQISRAKQQARKATNPEQRKQMERRLNELKNRRRRMQQHQQRLAAQRRALQTLQRQMKQTAGQKTDPKLMAELQKLMRQMQRYQHQVARSNARSQAKMSLKDLRELLKRLRAQKPGRKGRINDFFNRARGRRGGRGGRSGRPGGGRQGGRRPGGLGPIQLQPGGTRPGGLQRGQGRNGSQGPGRPGGHKAGSRPGGDVNGRPTSLDGERHEHYVPGRQQKGPSADQVVRGAADKGFTSVNYRKLYVRYRKLQKQILQEENIPPGYRYYVRRYFKLIRPRK